MLMPEKEYYSLEEMATRWHMSLSDIQYYAMHGQFEVMAWLDISVVNVYRLKKTEDGDSIPVASGLAPYKNYAVLASDELRQVFRIGAHRMRKFLDPVNHQPIEIHDSNKGYDVTADDLVISRLERDRCEQTYPHTSCSTNNNTSTKPISFVGRPSAMHQVRQHFLERGEQGMLLPSLQQEADYLCEWGMRNIKDGQPPKAKTIMNVLRDDYRQYSIFNISAQNSCNTTNIVNDDFLNR